MKIAVIILGIFAFGVLTWALFMIGVFYQQDHGEKQTTVYIYHDDKPLKMMVFNRALTMDEVKQMMGRTDGSGVAEGI